MSASDKQRHHRAAKATLMCFAAAAKSQQRDERRSGLWQTWETPGSRDGERGHIKRAIKTGRRISRAHLTRSFKTSVSSRQPGALVCFVSVSFRRRLIQNYLQSLFPAKMPRHKLKNEVAGCSRSGVTASSWLRDGGETMSSRRRGRRATPPRRSHPEHF